MQKCLLLGSNFSKESYLNLNTISKRYYLLQLQNKIDLSKSAEDNVQYPLLIRWQQGRTNYREGRAVFVNQKRSYILINFRYCGFLTSLFIYYFNSLTQHILFIELFTGMSFNTLSHSQHRTNSLSHTTLTRPNVTFNYVNAKTNTSVIDWDHNKNKVVSFNRPLFSNIHHPNRQVVPKMQKIKTGNQILSHRDHKRRKIFAKSQSNNDLGNLSYANSIQNYREFIENRQPSDMNEVKSKSSRRRNNIFQSYNPKSRIQSTKPQIFKNETSKVITSNAFDRPIHPRKLTNYMQLTPNRAPKILNQQSPVTKLSAQKYIKKIPLRDTYVAERDYQAKIISQNQQEPKNILQKEMYEIQLGKQDRSFNKKLQVGQLFNKSKNNLQNLQFQEESIIGYSQQQTHPHDQQTQDIPQLLLETNDRMMAKTQKSEQNKSKGELSSLVDIRLHTTVVSDKSQVFSKIVNKPIEQPSNIVQTPPSKSVLQNMPYLLVILGVLLLLIQLLK